MNDISMLISLKTDYFHGSFSAKVMWRIFIVGKHVGIIYIKYSLTLEKRDYLLHIE